MNRLFALFFNIFFMFLFLVESEIIIMRFIVAVPRPLLPLKPSKKEKVLYENNQGSDFQWSSIATMDQADFQARRN